MIPHTTSPERRKLLSFALVCLGALAPLARYLLEGHTLVWRDTSMLFQPIRPLVVEALRQLRWRGHLYLPQRSVSPVAVDISVPIISGAMKWPAGKHVLEMTYDPAEVKAGGVVSLIGLALCAILGVLEFRRLWGCKPASETAT
ncbi:hypothetical protein KP003_14685 [Geomonas nitrogeniifigens]|uniref:hypothetical protein n=1 Tax=Geomonas diazotrophica TaxID=2843197 RepID=UPI001C2C0B54|nr:hypothetical protein [Geomonas nitrogeniifigens]QXE85623.1 hypothetical protein KP003_14685 [Geomonas nitrogeniifigens]